MRKSQIAHTATRQQEDNESKANSFVFQINMIVKLERTLGTS